MRYFVLLFSFLKKYLKRAKQQSNNEVNYSMFKQAFKKEDFKDAETIIGPSVMIKGNFNSQGNIIIEGTLKGDVKTSSTIYIGDKARVTASIEAKTARAGGEIKGSLKIKNHLEVVASARIDGDIECSSLSVENGAIINGKCSMIKSDRENMEVEREEEKEEETETETK